MSTQAKPSKPTAKPSAKAYELDAKTRKAIADASLAEIKLRTLEGTLVDKAQRDAAEIARIQAARAHILSIPDRCATLGADRAIVKAIRGIINQAITELAADIESQEAK